VYFLIYFITTVSARQFVGIILSQVRLFLEEESIRCLCWPGNSPYLNPIENCWHILGTKIAGKKPENNVQLQACITRI
jgi:hypothetical protein